MRTRFVNILIALLSLAVALALSACKLGTAPHADFVLAPVGSHGNSDSTGVIPPPPPSSGLSIGVSDDSMATAGRQGNLQLFVANSNATAVTVDYRFTGPQGWPGFPATGSLAVAANASATADIPVAVPAGTAAGAYQFHYEIEKAGTVLQSGGFSMVVH